MRKVIEYLGVVVITLIGVAGVHYSLAEPNSYPYNPTHAKKTMLITWEPDPHIISPEMRDYEEDHGMDTSKEKVAGLAKFQGDFCNILLPDPKAEEEITKRELELMGHEVYHCFRGHWHD